MMKKLMIIIWIPILLDGCIETDIVDDFVGSNIIITNPVDTVLLGSTHAFTHRYTSDIGEILEINPEWHVTDEGLAHISEDGVLNTLEEGQVSVIVSYLDANNLIKDSLSVVITGREEMIEVTNAVSELSVGDVFQLNASYLNKYGDEEEADLTWSTSNDQVLDVDSNGMLEAISEGDVVITISALDMMVVTTLEITVNPPPAGEELRILNEISQLTLGDSYSLEFRYTDETGTTAETTLNWSSSNTSIASIDQLGNITSLAEGTTTISAVKSDDASISDSFDLQIVSDGVIVQRSGVIKTTSSYLLEGDFKVFNIEGGIRIEIADNYRASTALPELVLYITNNPNTINSDVSYEIASVTVFEGAHTYEVIEEGLDVTTYDYLLYYCKPFAVKVGDGQLENQ